MAVSKFYSPRPVSRKDVDSFHSCTFAESTSRDASAPRCRRVLWWEGRVRIDIAAR